MLANCSNVADSNEMSENFKVKDFKPSILIYQSSNNNLRFMLELVFTAPSSINFKIR